MLLSKPPLAPGETRASPKYGQFREKKEFQNACEIQAPGEKIVAPEGDEDAGEVAEAGQKK